MCVNHCSKQLVRKRDLYFPQSDFLFTNTNDKKQSPLELTKVPMIVVFKPETEDQ